MIPKILGSGAAILAAAFILALPSIVEGEPADEVEAIAFGPSPMQGLADATMVAKPPQSRDEQGSPLPAAAPAPEPLVPVTAPSGESEGGNDTGDDGTAAAQPSVGDERDDSGGDDRGEGDDSDDGDDGGGSSEETGFGEGDAGGEDGDRSGEGGYVGGADDDAGGGDDDESGDEHADDDEAGD